MSLRHPDLDAIARDLADLVRRGISPDEPSIARAEDALRAARSAATGDWGLGLGGGGGDGPRALAAIDEARDLLPLDEDGPSAPPPRQAQVELHSEIPDDHPEKPAIETAVAGAFAGVKGRWRVFILVQETGVLVGAARRGQLHLWTGTARRPRGAVARSSWPAGCARPSSSASCSRPSAARAGVDAAARPQALVSGRRAAGIAPGELAAHLDRGRPGTRRSRPPGRPPRGRRRSR